MLFNYLQVNLLHTFDVEVNVPTSSNITPQKRGDLDVDSQTPRLFDLSTLNMSTNKELKKIKSK